MMHRTLLRLSGFALALAVLSGSLNAAKADVVTFAGFGATPNGTQFTTYSETGFTVTPTQNRWNVAQNFGNPVPSIFSNSNANSVVRVTSDTTGIFTFSSVALAQDGNGASSYQITGFLGGNQVLLQAGTTTPNAFTTVNSVNSGQALDSLLIGFSFTSPTVFAYNIDNINVTSISTNAIPEPGTVVLSSLTLGLGLGISLIRRRWNRSAA